jgi:hypothetical protein
MTSAWRAKSENSAFHKSTTGHNELTRHKEPRASLQRGVPEETKFKETGARHSKQYTRHSELSWSQSH